MEFIPNLTKILTNASLNWDASNARHVDLTDATDDPGNTGLYIVFVPFGEYDDEEAHKPQLHELIKGRLEEQLNQGDHFDEILVTSQNNEFLIILNSNK